MAVKVRLIPRGVRSVLRCVKTLHNDLQDESVSEFLPTGLGN